MIGLLAGLFLGILIGWGWGSPVALLIKGVTLSTTSLIFTSLFTVVIVIAIIAIIIKLGVGGLLIGLFVGFLVGAMVAQYYPLDNIWAGLTIIVCSIQGRWRIRSLDASGNLTATR